jgi:hypothetical protein
VVNIWSKLRDNKVQAPPSPIHINLPLVSPTSYILLEANIHADSFYSTLTTPLSTMRLVDIVVIVTNVGRKEHFALLAHDAGEVDVQTKLDKRGLRPQES